MADNLEKQISIKIAGVEKALANLEKVEQTAAAIRTELAKTGKSLPETEIKRLAKDIANADVQAKKLGRSLKEAFRNIGKESLGSAGIAGGVAGLFGGFIGGGVATLIDKATTALYEWITAETDAQKAAREFSEANEEAIASFADEKVTLEVNTAILLDNTSSLDDKRRAMDELQELYPAYFENLNEETASVDDITEAYNNATDAIGLKIKAEVFSKLAVDKLIEIEKKRFQQQQIGNVLAKTRNEYDNSWFNTINTLGSLLPNVYDKAIEKQDELKEGIAKANEESSYYIDSLKDIFKLNNERDEKDKDATDRAANATKNAEKAEQKRKDAIKEGVTDLESAIRRLQEVQSTANEEEIEQAKELVRLYEEEAVAKIEAANAVEGLSGRTEQELKDALQVNEAFLKEIRSSYTVERDFIGDFFKNQGDTITKTIDNLGRSLVKIFDTKGIEFDINEFEGLLTTLFKESKNFQDFVEKAGSRGFLFPTLQPFAEEYIKQLETNKALIAELNKLKKQQQAAGFDVADIQKKANDAIIAAEDALIERQVEINKARAEALAKSPELLQKALELAGVADVETLKQNRIKIIEAEFDAAFVAEQEFIDKVTAERNKVLGSAVIGGSADEGFFVTKEAREKALPEEIAQLEKLANDANQRLSLARKRYLRDVENAEIDAIDQAVKNADIAAKAEVRRLRADLKTKELEQDTYYDDVLESNKRFAERMVEQNGELGEQDVEFIRAQKEAQIKLRQEAIDIELKAESDRYISILAQFESGSEAYLTALQEFENKKLEIVNKGQDDLKKIDIDFESIITGATTKEEGIKNFQDFWSQAQPIIQNIAQAIDNVFQILINEQQAIIDTVQERLSQVDTQLQETLGRIGELESDLEGKRSGRREAILRGIEEEREAETRLTQQKIELANRLAREEEKLAKKRKAAAIAQAVINGALAITNLNAAIVDPTPVQAFRIAANIALAAVIGTQIALIASQKFAEGGFTSDGQGGSRDETGEIPVGIVHNDEYVVPRWMVKSPKYRPVIDTLESVRKRGFAEGGFTSPDFASLSDSVNPNANSKVLALVQRSVDSALALSERPIIANPVEFTNVERRIARRVNVTTIGG